MNNKKQKKTNPQKSTSHFTSEAELDAELNRLLDKTLDDCTKWELAANKAFEALSNRGDIDALIAETSGGSEKAFEQNSTEASTTAQCAEEETPTSVLACLGFRDGGCFEFRARPTDGEIGIAYRGENEGRWLAATSDLASPLRLYCSLAPPDAPVPWLLAAVDRQPDRAMLVGNRPLCDTAPGRMPVHDDLVRLRLPGVAGGWWVPDSLGVGYFCGINGGTEFQHHICNWFEHHHPPSTSILENILKCTSTLSTSVTHKSISGGSWKRRRCSTGYVAACGGATRIKHQYRKLGFFTWNWKTANNDLVGPSNWIGTVWLGIIRRRRRIVYKHEEDIGGFRAWSKFSQHLTDD
jgi:hypothetical protein